jgi:hypothetical protein
MINSHFSWAIDFYERIYLYRRSGILKPAVTGRLETAFTLFTHAPMEMLLPWTSFLHSISHQAKNQKTE